MFSRLRGDPESCSLDRSAGACATRLSGIRQLLSELKGESCRSLTAPSAPARAPSSSPTGGSASDGWGTFPDYLDGDAFTWVFTDIRGYGQRKDEQGDQSLEESAGDILALADELGAERFSVVGHSMGGAVIQKVLAMAPERVEALVGVCPVSSTPSAFDEAGRELFWGAPEDRDKRYAIIDFTTGNRNTPGFVNAVTDWSLEHSTKEAFTKVLDAWAKPDFAEDVKGKELPVLVLVGEHDPALGKETCEQTWMQLFPKVRLEVVANAGHYPMFEAPVNLATRINNFLKEAGN